MDVDPVAVAGAWWRHVPAGGDVLHQPEDPGDSRWQRGTVVPGLYLADSPETVWAEWYRFLAEAGIPPMASMPRDLWRWGVDVQVADLSDLARLARVGLPVSKPGRLQWPLFQAVGESLWRDGWPGVLAPSASRPGSLILCLFRESRDVEGATPEPPPTLHELPPVPPRGMTT